MKEKLFIDTGAFFAIKTGPDSNHEIALNFFNFIPENNLAQFITSDFILFETVTLIKAIINNLAAIESGKQLRNSSHIEIINISENIIKNAWDIFDTYADKNFSFVDCTSFAVMKELKIKKAFTFDKHFEQFGLEIIPK